MGDIVAANFGKYCLPHGQLIMSGDNRYFPCLKIRIYTLKIRN